MSLDTLESLLVEQMRDLLYAEKQLVKSLPKLAKAASAPELQTAFKEHADATEGHVSRLEQAFESLGVTPKGKRCPAMDGLIEEASEMMDEEGDATVIDAGLIASAQRAEHYEIAAYGSIRAFADALGHADIVALVDATLNEEKAADKTLSEISSRSIIPAALGSAAANGEEEEDAADMSEEEEAEDVMIGEAGKPKRPADRKQGRNAPSASRRSTRTSPRA